MTPAARPPDNELVALDELRSAIAAIADPEVPVLTIEDLGVLRSIETEGGRVTVTITPTYSGCPAMQYIEDQIAAVITDSGREGEVRTVFRPAWTTEWMTDAGRSKLEHYGIAPPHALSTTDASVVAIRRPVRCPRCKSTDTEAVSEFGSTACKALYRCLSCDEPFDYFKEL